MPAVINLTMKQGEDRTFSLQARDWANAPLNLSGASISFRVGKSPYSRSESWPTFTKTGTVQSAVSGTYTVSVSAADTTYLEGDYSFQGWVTTVSGQVVEATEGRFRIQPYIQS